MKRATPDEQRAIVRRWAQAGAELQRVRYDALRARPYDGAVVDALLELGARAARTRDAAGMVEMQRYFMCAQPSLKKT